MKAFTYSKAWFARWMLILLHARPITCTCVFERLILRPSNLGTGSENLGDHSLQIFFRLCHVKIAMSSANLSLLIVPFMQVPRSRSWSAYSMVTSSNILKSCGEIMQPCLTPIWYPVCKPVCEKAIYSESTLGLVIQSLTKIWYNGQEGSKTTQNKTKNNNNKSMQIHNPVCQTD